MTTLQSLTRGRKLQHLSIWYPIGLALTGNYTDVYLFKLGHLISIRSVTAVLSSNQVIVTGHTGRHLRTMADAVCDTLRERDVHLELKPVTYVCDVVCMSNWRWCLHKSWLDHSIPHQEQGVFLRA